MNAAASGTAVSPKLWTVWASSATEPGSTTTTHLKRGGRAQDQQRKREGAHRLAAADDRGVDAAVRVTVAAAIGVAVVVGMRLAVDRPVGADPIHRVGTSRAAGGRKGVRVCSW